MPTVRTDIPTRRVAPADEEAVESLVGAGVPAVVAVVPTRDAGEGFDDVLEGLAAQEYANLEVLVVDAGGYEDPTGRVAERLPAAFVRRMGRRAAYAAAANEVLDTVEGAVFFLFLHDDVQLAPGAVRAMVAEAFRSNAGVVGAKLVDWEHHDRLLDVGASIDKFGFPAPAADEGELDQAQHDAVQEVFVVDGAVMLIRADLFADLGGFATDIDGFGEALDLCWRAQVAGARVIVMPGAVARHERSSALADPDPDADLHRLALRHQARILLACYSPVHLVRVLPQAALLSMADAVACAVSGRLRAAWDVVAAWGWNVVHLPTTLRVRGRVKRSRRVDDAEVRSLQIRGSARLNAFARGALSAGERRLPAALAAARGLPTSFQRGAAGIGAVAALVLAVIWAVGSRHLLQDGVPAVREFSPLGPVPWLFRAWWGGWSPAGLGVAMPSDTQLPLVWLANGMTFGSDGFVRTMMVLLPLPVGALGAWRLLRGVVGGWPRLALLIAYVIVPVPYDALAEGRLRALFTYAAMPWVLGRLVRASGVAPFADDQRRPARLAPALALVVAGWGAVAPTALLATLATAGLLAAFLVVVGEREGGRRVAVTGGLATALAALVLLPDLVALLSQPDPWGALLGGRTGAPVGIDLGDLLRLTSGAAEGGAILGAVALAAVVAVLVADGWRLRWAMFGWVMALIAWAVIVVVGRAEPSGSVPSLEALLVPAALGLALAVGIGAHAVEVDVLGGRFGWRQLAAVVGGAAVVVGVIPLLVSMAGGRWNLPTSDSAAVLAALEPRRVPQDRTLWLGDPDDLPLRSRPLVDGVGWALTDGAQPTLVTATAVGDGAAIDGLESRLLDAVEQGPGRLGAALAPYGIRYVVVQDGVSPGTGIDAPPAVAAVAGLLAEQLDLDVVDVAPGLSVYRNDDGWPTRSVADAAGARSPVLGEGRFPADLRGTLPADRVVDVALTFENSWRLDVGGVVSRPERTDAGLQRLEVGRGGDAALERRTPVWHRFLLTFQAAAVFAVAATAWRAGRRRRPRVEEVPLPARPFLEANAEPPDVDHDASLAELVGWEEPETPAVVTIAAESVEEMAAEPDIDADRAGELDAPPGDHDQDQEPVVGSSGGEPRDTGADPDGEVAGGQEPDGDDEGPPA